MPQAPHQTTPFRRPSGSWPHDTQPDPAEVGTAFGLELRLAGELGDPLVPRVEQAPTDDSVNGKGSNAPGAPTLYP